MIISEHAMTIVELLWHPSNYHSRENAIKITQLAIDEVADPLKKETERLKNLLSQVEDYMGHAPICCFKPPDGDRCDCGLWEVKRRINEAIGEQKGGE